MSVVLVPERQSIKTMLTIICDKYPAWTSLGQDKRETIIRRIERNCFEVTINQCMLDGIDRLWSNPKFVNRYSSVCFKVAANLTVDEKKEDSTFLLDGLILGSIDPYKVAEMNSAELCPAASIAERRTIEIRQKQKVPMKVSRAYTCSKCKGTETVYKEYQGRAIDEASSKSVRCIQEGCGHIWRIH